MRSQPVFRPARYWRDITVTLLRHVLSGWLSDGSPAPGWCCGEAARGSVSPTAVGVCYHLRRCSVASCALSSMLYSTGVIAYFGMVLAYCVYGVGLILGLLQVGGAWFWWVELLQPVEEGCFGLWRAQPVGWVAAGVVAGWIVRLPVWFGVAAGAGFRVGTGNRTGVVCLRFRCHQRYRWVGQW